MCICILTCRKNYISKIPIKELHNSHTDTSSERFEDEQDGLQEVPNLICANFIFQVRKFSRVRSI